MTWNILCQDLLYSRKYWWELNSAVGSQIAIANELVDLNLVVQYGIAMQVRNFGGF